MANNKHRVIHLAADADFTGSIFKVCSAHATSTKKENSHLYWYIQSNEYPAHNDTL